MLFGNLAAPHGPRPRGANAITAPPNRHQPSAQSRPEGHKPRYFAIVSDTLPYLDTHAPAPHKQPVAPFIASQIAMRACRYVALACGWVRPVAQPTARPVRPGIGRTSAWLGLGGPFTTAARVRLAPGVGVGRTKVRAPYRPGAARLPILPGGCAAPQRLRSLAVSHVVYLLSSAGCGTLCVIMSRHVAPGAPSWGHIQTIAWGIHPWGCRACSRHHTAVSVDSS